MPRLILTEAAMLAIVGRTTPSGRRNIAQFVNFLPDYQEEFGLDRRERLAPFIAQIAHECARFDTTTEYATGSAYEGRVDLGNTQPGDGKRFRGRGLIQTTGRHNYRAFTAWMQRRDERSPDFEKLPDLVATWPYALLSALWYWQSRHLNVLADAGDFDRITRKINGGTNGAADRRALLARANTEIAKIEAALVDETVRPEFVLARPTLRRGSEDGYVYDLQRGLRDNGFPVTVDGDFGPATEMAVKMLQRQHGLWVDGIVGPRTWTLISPTPGEDRK